MVQFASQLPYYVLWASLTSLPRGCVLYGRVLSRVYRLEENSLVAEGYGLSSGIRGHGNFLKLICAEMESGAFWDTILRDVTVVFYFFFSCDHIPCHILSLDWEYLVHVRWARRVWIIFPIYSLIPVTRTLYNSNLPLTRSNLRFPWDRFLYNFTLDNSNSR